MSSDNVTAMKLGGAKRKNGHKMNCECHICQNMKNKAKRGGYKDDAEKEKLKMMGGSKKKNGHKPDCNCPICKNMRNAKKTMKTGKSMKTDKNANNGKKSNGHKMNCGCPICKNMGKKTRKGGAEVEATDEEYKDIDAIPKATTKSDTNTVPATPTTTTDTTDTTNTTTNTDTTATNLQKGGRKRKTMKKSMKKRGNGHKANCMCPICKNMRNGSKTKRR